MMRFLFYFGIGLVAIILVLKRGQCIVIVANERGTSIECSSNADITFNFNSPVQSASVTIAECVKRIANCFLLKTVLENTYGIVYSGRGGILKINHTGNDTYGTYECRETHDHMNYVTVDIIPPYNDSWIGNITLCEGEEKTEKDEPFLIFSIIAICLTMTTITIVAVRVMRQLKRKDPLMAGYSGLEQMKTTLRAFGKEMEKVENTINGLCTNSAYGEDSQNTFANAKTDVEEIRRRFTCVTEALNTVRDAPGVHVRRQSFGVRVSEVFKKIAKRDKTNKDVCEEIPLRLMGTNSQDNVDTSREIEPITIGDD